MKRLSLIVLLCVAPCVARAADTAALRAELAGAERAFCAQAAALGIADAFLANMAPDCFLPDSLSLSRAEYAAKVAAARAKLGAAYKAGPNPDVRLTWAPIKVDVSDDGTLGYTWGRYDYSAKGKDGKTATTTGLYFTVWKRQADGAWKVVYDGGPQPPDDAGALARFLARPDLPGPGAGGRP